MNKADTIFNSFPSFDSKCICTFDCREDCFLKVYEDVTENDFKAYLSTLEKDGFDVLQKNEINGNQFAALLKNVQINLLYTPCDSTLRITASEKNLTPNFKKTECTGDCQTTFYAFENDQTIIDCGMCLMIQCPDYSFFLVDSGHYFQMNDNDRIHKFMRERTPEGQKIVVNGWLITHGHTDHISKLIDFLKYNTDDVIIEGFYQNLQPSDYGNEDGNHEEKEMVEKLFRILDEYSAPVYKLHTGMRFYIRNLAFDVLSTHEDLHPDYIEDYNDSSCVVMMETEGSKVFIPGDAAVMAGKKMEERFGETLKCDVAQIAHHGHTGLSTHCYELLGADTVVFPVTRIFFEADLDRKEENKKAVELASNCYVTGDGTVVVPLPYNKDTVTALPDETFEDFEKIKRIWRYVYSEERKKELYETFLAHGGDENNILLPTSPMGWIEPKPPIEE